MKGGSMSVNREITLLESMEMRKKGISNPYEYAESHDSMSLDEKIFDFSIGMKSEEKIKRL
jgi:hypothetical protein